MSITKCAFVVKYYTYKKINISPKIPAEKKDKEYTYSI